MLEINTASHRTLKVQELGALLRACSNENPLVVRRYIIIPFIENYVTEHYMDTLFILETEFDMILGQLGDMVLSTDDPYNNDNPVNMIGPSRTLYIMQHMDLEEPPTLDALIQGARDRRNKEYPSYLKGLQHIAASGDKHLVHITQEMSRILNEASVIFDEYITLLRRVRGVCTPAQANAVASDEI